MLSSLFQGHFGTEAESLACETTREGTTVGQTAGWVTAGEIVNTENTSEKSIYATARCM